MAEDKYELKWAKHQDSFISLFEQFYEKETLVDCTLRAEEQELKAHRMVLMACSPYLHEVLSEYSIDCHPVVNTNLKVSALKLIVQFCYRGQVTVPQSELEDFFHAAILLQIKGLTNNKDEDKNDESTSENEADTQDTPHHNDSLKDGDGQGSDDSEDSDFSMEDEDIENLNGKDGFVEAPATAGNIIIPWICTRCGVAFPTRSTHDHHRKSCVIHRELPWKCEQCCKTYKNKKDLVRHKIHCGKELPRLACNSCGSTYKYGRGLKRHLTYCGKDLVPFRCSDCDKTFKYYRGLKKHQMRCGVMEALAKLAEKGVTPVLIRKKDGNEDKTPQPIQQTIHEDGSSVCKRCGKTYKYRRSLKNHQEICYLSLKPTNNENIHFVERETNRRSKL